jgi:protein-S-isoprenylcysteine O-methyltransferase Ste14
MIKFDPLGWFEHILPLPWLHRIIRLCAIAIVSVFLVVRIGQYQNYFWKPLWAAETLLFIVLAIAFIVRSNPVDRSKGVKEIIVPLIGGVLPFFLLRTPPGAWIIGNTSLLTTLFLWMTLATALTIWGMWVLRYSFSITIEARALVTRGPYRWVRHPIYLGEILASTAVVVWRWSWLNVAIFLLFLIIQILRARWEESKLKKIFPEYRELLSRTWWFWSI